MWTVINGFDCTDVIPFETITASQMAGDQLPSCTFDIVDTGCTLSFDVGQEVIIFNEHAPPTKTLGGTSIPTIPTHNLCVGIPNATYWKQSGTLGSLVVPSGILYQMTFNNSAVGQGFIQFQSFYGYIHPGQRYMFSAYINITTPLTNAQGILQLEWLDAGGNVLGSPITLAFTTATSNQHMNISGTAPANAVYALCQMGGSTSSTTNSGVITFGSPQCEPMWFVNRGVAYPTPDCNAAQVNSALMPDLTISRMCRIFAGYINDLQITYDDTYAAGPNRTWHISCAGYGAVLENATYTGAFDSQTDAQIIQSVFANYSNWINVTNAANTSSPNPIITGITVDAISFNENTLRDVLNSLTALSGFLYYVDYYATLYYLPAYYSAAPFTLTDQPDNVTSFSYYEYQLEKDATQQKWDVTVVGGKFLESVIQDSFTGDGSTTVFNLSQQPYNIHQTTVAGSLIKVGISKRDKFTGGITALYNKVKKTLTFQTAPANGAAIIVQYTYEAPIVVECIDDSVSKPISPAYALPPFVSKIHDTNLTSTAAATTRGLVELTNLSKPLVTITCKSQQFASVGQIIYFTASLDGILNQPYVVQEVDAKYLGNGINEFSYTLGYYRPTFTDHSRHIHKATVRSTTTAAVDVVLQTDLVITELTAYSEVVTATPIGINQPTFLWGSGIYGQHSYGSYSATVLSDTPIRYYRLSDTNTTAIDSGSQAQNGTLHGTIIKSQPTLLLGDANTSMLFDGSTGYISLPLTGLPTGAAPWTLECWCEITTLPASGFYIMAAMGMDANQQGALIDIYSNGTNVQFVCSTYNGDIMGGNVMPNVPYHVVGTYDGTNTRLYVNGQLVAGPSPFTLNLAQAYASIGAHGTTPVNFFPGIIDEVAIYNIALPASRIQAHYAMGMAGGYASTVLRDAPKAYYRLGERSGFVANDMTNLYNGTIHGGVALGQNGLLSQDSNTAMLFNGTSGYINLPLAITPTGAAPWTLECWCEITTLPASGFYIMAAMGMDANQQGALIDIYSNGTNVQFVCSTYNGDIMGGNVMPNVPYHVVGTYDGTNTRLYVNGQLVAGPSPFTLNLAQAYASIGAHGTTPVNFFPGIIDEVAIYWNQLSLSRILAHYAMGMAGTYVGSVLADYPIRYYRLNETAGTIAHDMGSQLQNGGINGGTTLNQPALILDPSAPASMLFDGSTGYISIPTSSLLPGNITVEAWAQVNSFADDGSGVSRRLVMLNLDGTNAFQLTIASGGLFVWAVNDTSGQVITSVQGFSAGIYHLVGTWNAMTRTVVLYVNGVAQPNNGGIASFGIGTSGAATIARRTDGKGYFPGLLEEVAIYNYALPANRVTAHYNAGIA